jgi:hypothetical protein
MPKRRPRVFSRAFKLAAVRRPLFFFHSAVLTVPALPADVVLAFILFLTEDVSLIEVLS